MGVAGSIGGVLQRRRRGGATVDYGKVVAGNVDSVRAWVEAHPGSAAAVHQAEAEGKARVSLLAWLDEQIAAEGAE